MAFVWRMYMHGETITLRLSAGLVAVIDEAAKQDYTSRSAFIRESIMLRLNNQRIVSKPSDEEFLKNLERFSTQNSYDS